MFWLAICIVLVLIIIYCFSRPKTQEIVIRGMVVNVVGDPAHRNQAISIMLECNGRMIRLLDHLRKKYMIGVTDAECDRGCQQTKTKYPTEREIIAHLLHDFNYENIHENKPQNGKDVAYSLNKGRTIMLCLRDAQKNGRPVDIDTLMFVTIHEAAHIANYDQWGHGERFWSIFKYLLEEAVAIGAYHPVDYVKHPTSYCGFIVNHNPYFEPQIKSLIPRAI